ncbi:arginine/ornithine antiporter [Citrobacter freundii]|nr:arginine/ornithine antiporter [Citrobacter freundii]
MEKKLGLSALTALVLSSMLGAGVFSLPQNMAAVASPAALLIGWAITGAGILLLAFAMLILTRIRPELDGGIFTYAREGFGELIGFCSAWGYWLCAVIANVSYLVIVFSALSFFTDTPELRLFGDGNTWQSIVGASVLLWVVHFLVLRGVQTAASINLVATLAKLLPLGLFIVLAFMLFKLDTFTLDFTGVALGVPVWEQVKNTMLITLWVFHRCGRRGGRFRPSQKQTRCRTRYTAGGTRRAGRLPACHPAVSGRCCASRTGGDPQPVHGRSDGGNDGAMG